MVVPDLRECPCRVDDLRLSNWPECRTIDPDDHGLTNCTRLTVADTGLQAQCGALLGLQGKKYDVLGMNPLKTPPPTPAMKASINNGPCMTCWGC